MDIFLERSIYKQRLLHTMQSYNLLLDNISERQQHVITETKSIFFAQDTHYPCDIVRYCATKSIYASLSSPMFDIM